MEYLVPILTLLVLLMAAYTDISSRTIPNWLTFGGMVIAVIIQFIHPVYVTWYYLLGIIPGVGMLLAYVFKKHFGAGDIKLALFIGLAIGGLAPIFILGFAMILMLFYAVYKMFVRVKRQGIPMAPFFLVATALLYVVNYAGLIKLV